jgi:hypothetical protein
VPFTRDCSRRAAGTGSAHAESLRVELAAALRGPLGQKAARDARRWALRLDPATPPARARSVLEVSADVEPDGPRESLRRAAARAAVEAAGGALEPNRLAAAEDAVLVERYAVTRDIVTGRVSVDGEVLERALKSALPPSSCPFQLQGPWFSAPSRPINPKPIKARA